MSQMINETDEIIRDLEDTREKRARQIREKENPSKERIPDEQKKQQEEQAEPAQQMQEQGKGRP